MTVTVIVPAHNEQEQIADTIDSLLVQSRPADQIIVVANNCTDNTAAYAAHPAVIVMEMHNNRHKKSGAINHALDRIIPDLADDDAIIVMDADTVLSNNFIEVAERNLIGRVGGVGGAFYCKSENTLIQTIQGNEYARYVREISRRGGKANVLTGAGSMFKVRALREVYEARQSGNLPGVGFYDVNALTEDNEMTLALKRLGWTCVSPDECTIHTDSPANLKGLYHQRLRWRRGAMQNLSDHGFNRTTAPYVIKMFWTAFVTLVGVAYFVTLIGATAAGINMFHINWFWNSIFLLYVVERLVTVWSRRHGRVIAAAVIPELLYDIFQQVVFVAACIKYIKKAPTVWVS